MHFSRLRLTGFKSFVDPTDLLIEPGLTAIVGPNGCGKSNLVEALRWVMGENSARQMRGRDMDDVIFAGSANRPGRNSAEVAILLDNAARTAPQAYNDRSEIEVSRRIERGEGSIYRINGSETRARDVQLLFADEVTGARSTALVSQGEIGALIAAKPAQRRRLLDEAAGITGLHSRRHEAEQRLRAAEGNLERLDDVMGGLDAQYDGLKRQARQANRYRRLNERIRETEALLLYRRWRAAGEALVAAERGLAEIEQTVADVQRAAATAATAQAEATAAMPPLREAESEARARLHRLEVAQVELEAEERRLADARQALETRLAQIDADVERETALAGDAEAAVGRLEEERAALTAKQASEEAAEAGAATDRDAAAEAVAEIERRVDELATRLAGQEARRGALTRQIEAAEARIEHLRRQAAEVEREIAAAEDETASAVALADAETALATARDGVAAKRTAVEAAEAARSAAQTALAAVGESLQAAEAAYAAARAEEAALARSLGAGIAGGWSALIDDIEVEAGLETALGVALGDDLLASTDAAAPVHWQTPAADAKAPALPKGATPLGDIVKAPPALARRLAQIGVVDADDGPRLQKALAQGQRLVSRDGALWRWDGLTVASEAGSPAAERLSNRNRLADARATLADCETRRDEARREHEAARDANAQSAADEAAARGVLRRAEDGLEAARETRAGLTAATAAQTTRRANLEEARTRLAGDIAEAAKLRDDAKADLDAMVPDVDGRADLDAQRAELAARRARLTERDGAYNRLHGQSEARRERLWAIADELPSWQGRAEGAKARLEQLAERRAGATTELEALADRPAAIAEQRAALFERLAVAQSERKTAADAVAEAETRLAACDRRLKEAEATVGETREERGRCEGALRQGDATRDEIVRTISERLNCAPTDLAGLAGIEQDAELPDAEQIDAQLARFVRQRDAIGPVNLRAEVEADDVEQRLGEMRNERADLEAAIIKLRQAISRLNREGRERLETAFTAIDAHFSKLFTGLFGGGRAHLALVDSDDPLEAGLEIMASPPGKRLQTLSLLSGGEQALTALALLFAVFLTNPTPICVLDEVDAPLDDSNVGRFCDLVDDIARGSATRFLIITHHHITMARMDRLFGVTMSERGVSQLVSVDLRTAEALRVAETAAGD